MAKKFDKEQLSRGKSIMNPDDDFNPDEYTYDVITDFEKNPKKEDIPKVVDVIEKDAKLPEWQKEVLIARLKENFIELFNLENVPDDYASLKNESKFLSDLVQYSFACLAVRLKKIRDNELYREDDYPDFKSFIDAELSMKRSAVYNYIDLVTVFGVQTFGHVTEPAKLIPALPLLRAADKNKDIPVAKIKKDILKNSEKMSARELNERIKELKVEYGLSKPAEAPVQSAEEYYSGKIITIAKSIKKTITEYEKLEAKLLKSAESFDAKSQADEAYIDRQQARIYSNVISRFYKIYNEAENALRGVKKKQSGKKGSGKTGRK